jgi:L,D-peptidoglycan transpeptidase YkuD (ErfK/YbiS/YcfS/YnhG family)
MNTRVVLTNRIAMTSATLLAAGAIGLTGLASAASSPDSESPTGVRRCAWQSTNR